MNPNQSIHRTPRKLGFVDLHRWLKTEWRDGGYRARVAA